MQDILNPKIINSQSVDAFRVTGEEDEDVEEKKTNAAKLQFLSTALYAAFGTPNEPYIFPEFHWNAEEKKGLDLARSNWPLGRMAVRKTVKAAACFVSIAPIATG